MRLTCPYCGERDAEEFAALGSAVGRRPDPDAPDAAERFHAYVHLRDNPAGLNREHWYHAQGCRRWLVVMRDTHTHKVFSVALAQS
jgi:sarcosine oxidase subunit delta